MLELGYYLTCLNWDGPSPVCSMVIVAFAVVGAVPVLFHLLDGGYLTVVVVWLLIALCPGVLSCCEPWS